MKKVIGFSTLVLCCHLITVNSVADTIKNKMVTSGSTSATKLSLSNGFVGQFDQNTGQPTFIWHQLSHTRQQKSASARHTTLLTQSSLRKIADKHLAKIQALPAFKGATGIAKLSYLQWQNSKPIIAKYQQQVNQIDVYAQQMNVLMDQYGDLVASSGYFSTLSPDKAGFSLTPQQAVAKAFANMGGYVDPADLPTPTKAGRFQQIQAPDSQQDYALSGTQRLRQIYFPAIKQLLPAYQIELSTETRSTHKTQHLAFIVSAVNGKILMRKNQVSADSHSYLTFASSAAPNIPYDSPAGSDITPFPLSEMYNPDVEQGELTENFVSQNLITLDAGPINNPQDNPWLSAEASNNFRCYQQATTQMITCGNNVSAYIDVGADRFHQQDGDFFAAVTRPGRFEYIWDHSKDAMDVTNQKAALVNMFYTVNWLHDWFYDHGFDEAAGNAQMNNYGRGGFAQDPILAEGQDRTQFIQSDTFPDENNANMYTPGDGSSPQMQMFLWDAAQKGSVLLTGVSGLTDIEFTVAQFGPDSFTANQSLIVAQDDDTNGSATDGCSSLTNAGQVAGKVVLVDRGECNFTDKVKNIQIAGGIGAMVVDNVSGSLITMSGEDDSITIPAIFVSLADGNTIKATLNNNSVNVSITSSYLKRDSTLDNAVIAHEWGHYLTNRLIGDGSGLVSNQSGALGEGWGDFVALLMMTREEDEIVEGNAGFDGLYNDGGYSVVGLQKNTNGVSDNDGLRIAYSVGLRRAPYTTNKNYNALTFKHIEQGVSLPTSHYIQGGISGDLNAKVHSAGEIWALSLWQGYTNLIKSHGLTNAQNRMKDYLVASLKITPLNPTFTEARDAVLASAYAVDKDDFTSLLEGFAARGLGIGAVSPQRFNEQNQGVIESFVDSAISMDYLSTDILISGIDGGSECDNDGIWDIGERANFTLKFKNSGSIDWSNLKLVLSSDADIHFEQGDSIAIPNNLAFGEEFELQFSATLNRAYFGQQLLMSFHIEGDSQFDAPTIPSITMRVNQDLVQTSQLSDGEIRTAAEYDWSIEHTYNLADDDSQLWSLEQNIQLPELNMMWHGSDIGSPGVQRLISPSVSVAATGDFSMSFEHFYHFEFGPNDEDADTAWDGGVVEISIENGVWQDVTDAGGVLTIGYDDTPINEGAEYIGGRAGFVGQSDGLLQETLTFADGSLNGKSVRFRFVIGTDAAVGDTGWYVDNIAFANTALPPFSDIVNENGGCGVTPPTVEDIDDFSVNEQDEQGENSVVQLSVQATDNESAILSYQWRYLGDQTIQLVTADQAMAEFTAPSVVGNQTLMFEVEVSDGQYIVNRTVNVTIVDSNTPPTLTVQTTELTVTEGETVTVDGSATDPDGDDVTIQWTQTSGTTVEFTNSSSGIFSFVAPQVSVSSVLTFQVWAKDGEATSQEVLVTITVNNKTVTTPPTNGNTSSSSGGGGFSWVFLLLLWACYPLQQRDGKPDDPRN